jgi:hypothetical protein
MSSTSGQAKRVLAFAAVATVLACLVAARTAANEPDTIRVVSIQRSAGQVTLVVAVPTRLVAAASPSGGLVVDDPAGRPLAPTVTPVTAAETALAIVLHTAGSTQSDRSKAAAVAAELIRTIDPGVAVTLVTTAGGAVVSPLGTDHAAAMATLSHPIPDGPEELPEALTAVAGELAGGPFLDPLVVVIDAGPMSDTSSLAAELPALPGAHISIIPIRATPSPLAGQLADRLGVKVSSGADPVALIDDSVGLLRGRFRVTFPDPGAVTVTVHVGNATTEMTVPAVLPAPPASAEPTTPAPRTATTKIAESSPPLPETATPSSVTPARKSPSSRSLPAWLVPIVAGAAMIAGGVAVAAHLRRRARHPKGDMPDDPANVSGLSIRRPHRRVILARRPRRTALHTFTELQPAAKRGIPPPPPRATDKGDVDNRGSAITEEPSDSAAEAPGSSPDPVYERRLRVLALAEELGNVSEACRIVGVSRRTFYLWKRIAETDGVQALQPKGRRPDDHGRSEPKDSTG